MPRPAPLALAVWPGGVGMDTVATVNVTGGTIGSEATTVIATGIEDMATAGSEYHVTIKVLSSLLLTLNDSERRRSRSPDRRRY